MKIDQKLKSPLYIYIILNFIVSFNTRRIYINILILDLRGS